MKDHPLFPDKPEADVVSIHVLRFENGRKNYAAQKFVAEELTEIGQVFDVFGGGHYELEARGPHKGGTHGIVARAVYQMGGTSRPLNPEPPAPAPAAAPVATAAPAPAGDLVAVLLQQAGEDRRMMMNLMMKMTDRPAAPPPADSGLATVLSAMIAEQGATTRAILQGQSSGGGGGEKDPIGRVLEVMKVVTDLKEGMAEGLAERGKSGDVDLGTLAEGLNKMIGVVKDAKTLVDSGAGPEAAAEAAARAAE